MRQLILYIIFLVSMVLSGCGEISAASDFSNFKQEKFQKENFLQGNFQQKKTEDRLEKVEHKENQHDAQLEDASVMAYRVCSNRPQRLLPTGNIHANGNSDVSKLLFNKIRFLSHLLFADGGKGSRLESAPFHFDVASKYYVICLRHLRC